MNKVISLPEFYKLLEKHQWFAEMSDSREIEVEAAREFEEISQIIWASKDDRYSKLYGEFHKHMWSGPVWGTPKYPKPELPAQEEAA